MHRTVKTEVFYPYPPQQIWQVLTDRRALTDWLMENDFEPRIGHKFRFWTHSLPGLEGIIYCQVLELDEPKLLSYTWQDNMMQYASIVIWKLTPVSGGTQLQLEHQGLRQEAIASGDRCSTHTWQSQFIYESIEVTQTLAPIPDNTSSQSIPVARYEALDSIILNSFVNGKWDYELNERLPQVLVSLAANNK